MKDKSLSIRDFSEKDFRDYREKMKDYIEKSFEVSLGSNIFLSSLSGSLSLIELHKSKEEIIALLQKDRSQLTFMEEFFLSRLYIFLRDYSRLFFSFTLFDITTIPILDLRLILLGMEGYESYSREDSLFVYSFIDEIFDTEGQVLEDIGNLISELEGNHREWRETLVSLEKSESLKMSVGKSVESIENLFIDIFKKHPSNILSSLHPADIDNCFSYSMHTTVFYGSPDEQEIPDFKNNGSLDFALYSKTYNFFVKLFDVLQYLLSDDYMSYVTDNSFLSLMLRLNEVKEAFRKEK